MRFDSGAVARPLGLSGDEVDVEVVALVGVAGGLTRDALSGTPRVVVVAAAVGEGGSGIAAGVGAGREGEGSRSFKRGRLLVDLRLFIFGFGGDAIGFRTPMIRSEQHYQRRLRGTGTGQERDRNRIG